MNLDEKIDAVIRGELPFSDLHGIELTIPQVLRLEAWSHEQRKKKREAEAEKERQQQRQQLWNDLEHVVDQLLAFGEKGMGIKEFVDDIICRHENPETGESDEA